jgi:very-short-patch-repair endonuclease
MKRPSAGPQDLFISRGSVPSPVFGGRLGWGAHLRLRQVHGHEFRRQRPIGAYIVDFVCLEERVVIEVDGSQHLERALLDARRDACVEPRPDDYLESLGFRVLRFWDNQVLNETYAIIEVIPQVLEKREEGPPSLRQAQGRL